MGRSTLPKDAIIELREHGKWTLYQITNAGSTWHTGVCEDTIPAGTPIHRCVWKKDHLEVRKVRVKLTPATKTVEQWQAECKAQYEAWKQAQIDFRQRFDAAIAGADPNNPVELMTRLMTAALGGKL
jgi:hypothetical protein